VLSPLRSHFLEKLSEQRHLTEDELVIVGLKYLYKIQWKNINDPSMLSHAKRDRTFESEP
jgi:hypothetical protein